MIIDTIIKNITDIPSDAYMMTNPPLSEPKYSQETVHPEDNFVSEIKILLCKHTSFRENLFQIHVNKTKLIKGKISNPFLSKQFYEMEYKSQIAPDLIIHKAQYDTDPNNQLFSMECKIDPNLNYNKFKKDLFKLMLYKEALNYRENLYLIVNNDNKKLYEYLEKYKSDNLFFSKTGILIVNIEKYGVQPKLIYSNP